MQRRRFKQSAPLDQRLSHEAERLLKVAQGTPPGIKRDNLIRQVRQLENRLAGPGVARLAGPASAPLMPEYRAYIVGEDGHLWFAPMTARPRKRPNTSDEI